MKLEKILEGSEHAMSLFGDKETRELEKKIVERPSKKGGVDYYVKCVCREKNVKLTPEEVVRQLYAAQLIKKYHYPVERLCFEYSLPEHHKQVHQVPHQKRFCVGSCGGIGKCHCRTRTAGIEHAAFEVFRPLRQQCDVFCIDFDVFCVPFP